MSWQERLAESVKLVSPSGVEFEAQWVGDARAVEKKVGIFTFPKIPGAEVQDLRDGGVMYPLTIYFEGPDNDILSDQFFTACGEEGEWAVTHPVRGLLSLQLLAYSEEIQPTTSANITRFVLEWIEPIPPSTTVSTPQLATEINAQAVTVNDTATTQFALESVFQTTFSEIAAIRGTVEAVVIAVKKILAPIYTQDADINSRVTAIQRGLQGEIEETPLDAVAIAGQVQNMIQLPLLATTDAVERMTAYTSMLDELAGITLDGSDREAYNVALTKELAMAANHTSMAKVAATSLGSIDTRKQALSLSATMTAAFSAMTDALDVDQALFLTEDIDNQYFSQSHSFYATADITAKAVRYLLVASFDLKKEKRFTLPRSKAPIFVAIEEYGGLGENDENFDLLIRSNNLKDLDILLLPAGREVVVYV